MEDILIGSFITDFKTEEVEKRQIYFEPPTRYWSKDAEGKWIPLNETGIKRLLKKTGFNKDSGIHDKNSVDSELLRIQMENNVVYAGSLAGYKSGVYEMLGNKILVTTSARLLEPRAGKWPILGQLIENLLVGEINEGEEFEARDIDQRPYFYGWLKIALNALYEKKNYPGQALVLAGERDCGKSLLQSILTALFGGRVAKPYKHMTDRTIFNKDMFQAEHLIIGDEAVTIRMEGRKHFAAQIKQIVAERDQRLEGKHQDSVMVSPFWRLTISLNLEPENLMVLPPIDEDIADKIMLFKAYKKQIPWASMIGPEDRETFWNTLLDELPAFVHYILCEFEIPDAIRSSRFGIVHYHHPEILGVINAMAPQERLLELIDVALFQSESRDRWEGTALDLERKLKDKESPVCEQARDLIRSPNALGNYLGKLKIKYPNRFKYKHTTNKRIWKIRTL